LQETKIKILKFAKFYNYIGHKNSKLKMNTMEKLDVDITHNYRSNLISFNRLA